MRVGRLESCLGGALRGKNSRPCSEEGTIYRAPTREKRRYGESAFPGVLNLLAFPVAAFEENDADGGHGCFGDNDGPIDAVRLHARVKGQEVRERNFEHPEREEVD